MRTIEHTGKFKRDYKRETRGKSREQVRKLEFEPAEVVKGLAADETLPPRFNDHALSGDWKDHRDCHINPDLVLIYRKRSWFGAAHIGSFLT